MRLALILILAVFLGLLGQNGAADAGAWPRGEGKFFFALSQDQTERQLYAEYGFRGDWTLGLEVTQPTGRRLPAVAGFVHHPVLRFKNGAIVSAGLAVAA